MPFNQAAATLLTAMVCGLAFAADEQKPIQLTPTGCQSYAVWSGNLVWASDLGADKEKARAQLIALNEESPRNIYALMLQNLDALWNTSADWKEVTVMVMRECLLRRGTYSADELAQALPGKMASKSRGGGDEEATCSPSQVPRS